MCIAKIPKIHFTMSDVNTNRWIRREWGGPLSQQKRASHLGSRALSRFSGRLIGTATVALKDLIGDQSRSLPYKLIPLLNEKGQDTGVSTFSLVEWLWSEIRSKKFIKKSEIRGTWVA